MAESPDTSRTQGEFYQQDDEHCDKCELLRRRIHAGEPIIKGRRCFPQTCFFKLHWDVGFINPPTDRSGRIIRKAKRLSMCEDLAKYASALMNSHGGTILIHIDGLSQDDFYLGYLDEMVAEKLHSLLERGQLSSNAFRTVSLGELDSRYREYVLFCVNGSSQFVTQGLNTCVALDDRILEAPGEVVSEILVSKAQARKMPPKIRGTHFSKEGRDIQFKRFKPPSFLEVELKNNPEKTALYIWKDLGLREYLTAFAKLPEGGSYFLGVGEKEKSFHRYKTKTIELEGIPEGFVDIRVIRQLEKFFRNSTILCNCNGKFIRSDPSNFRIFGHYNEFGKNILECSIAPMNGILFYTQTGPVSYKVQDGKLRQVAPEEWYDAMTRKHKTDGTTKHRNWKHAPPEQNRNSMKTEVAKTLINRASELSEEDEDGSKESCFAYVEESVRTALQLSPDAILPLEIICEAVILIPRRFGFVLSICRGSRSSADILTYNCQLGRDLTAAVRLYTNDNFVFLTEVASVSDISSREAFSQIMTDLERYAYSVSIPDMFRIKRQHFENLISAIGVCSFQGEMGDEIQMLISTLKECNNLSNTVCHRLMEIAAEVDELEQSKRTAIVLCAATGLLGSAMSISGFLLGPVGMPLVMLGATVGLSGGVGQVAASVVVGDKTNVKIKEAQRHLSDFKDVCERLRHEINVNAVFFLGSMCSVAQRALLLSVFDVLDDIFASGLKISKLLGVFLSALLVPLEVYKLISNVVNLIEKRPSAVAAQLRSKVHDMEEVSKVMATKISDLEAIPHSGRS